MRVAVLGASGYAGAETLRILADHPHLRVVAASAESGAGATFGSLRPGLAAAYGARTFVTHDEAAAADADVVVLALPHGASAVRARAAHARGQVVADLGADLRLRDAADFTTWYGQPPGAPELLGESVYALVERHRAELAGARLLAIPGCYPTATILALGPFLDAGVIERTGIVVNALSGASGAGRALRDDLHFAEAHGTAHAYGVGTHRHTVEIERELDAQVVFVPHLVPASRGLLVTAYARVRDDALDPLEVLRAAYRDEPFVVVSPTPPGLKDAVGSNLCFVHAVVDPRTGWLVAMASIDNLTKGAAGQAVQALNVALGYEETAGLTRAAVAP